MEAKELRIGNYLNFSGVPTAINAGFIYGYDYSQKESHRQDAIDFDDVSPIPLTEEWLLKLGFKKKITSNKYFPEVKSIHYENVNCWIYLIKDGFELELNSLGERFNLGKLYRNVHQLQNLYFALTGKELQEIENL